MRSTVARSCPRGIVRSLPRARRRSCLRPSPLRSKLSAPPPPLEVSAPPPPLVEPAKPEESLEPLPLRWKLPRRPGPHTIRPSFDVEAIFGASVLPAARLRHEARSQSEPSLAAGPRSPTSLARKRRSARHPASHRRSHLALGSLSRGARSSSWFSPEFGTRPGFGSALSARSGTTPPLPTPATPAVTSPDAPATFVTSTPAPPPSAPSSQRLKLVPEQLDTPRLRRRRRQHRGRALGQRHRRRLGTTASTNRPPLVPKCTRLARSPRREHERAQVAERHRRSRERGPRSARLPRRGRRDCGRSARGNGHGRGHGVGERLPGPLRHPSLRPGAEPAKASECGPVLKTLYRLGAKSVPFLVVRTNDGDPVVRRWAAHLLGELPAPRARTPWPAASSTPMRPCVAPRSPQAGYCSLTPTSGRSSSTSSPSSPKIARRGWGCGSRRSKPSPICDTRSQYRRLIRVLADGAPDIEEAARSALVVVARQDFGPQGSGLGGMVAWQRRPSSCRVADRSSDPRIAGHPPLRG